MVVSIQPDVGERVSEILLFVAHWKKLCLVAINNLPKKLVNMVQGVLRKGKMERPWMRAMW